VREGRLHLFGIRHHGPGSALALTRALDAIAPSEVLIEGPPEADPLLPLAASPAMRPPLALLAYAAEDPSLAVFFPFAEYSPEWRAILWAAAHRTPVRFIDLPVTHRLAEMQEEKAAPRPEPAEERDAEVAAPIGKAVRRDPIGYLGRLVGYDDGEAWWNNLIEQGAPAPEIFAAIELAMTALREESDAGPAGDERLREERREAYMRLAISEALKRCDGPVAVVTGAWHVPALRRKIKPGDDRAILRGLAKTKPVVTFVPWTDTRLAFRSGYGAGVLSPGWYRHLWNEFATLDAGAPLDTRRLTSSWQTRVGALLRAEGLAAPTASIIEAARLAEALAGLRGLTLPGLTEMRDASLATLCQGETAAFALIESKLVIGTLVGEIDDAVPQMPLQADLIRLQKQSRLKPSADATELSVDLRSENGLLRSTLLHRLNLIGVAWGRIIDAGNSRGSFRERWMTAWEPEYSVRLAEALVWGTTIAEAAANRASLLIAESDDPRTLAELVNSALVADLPAAVEGAIARLQTVAARSNDLAPLIEAVPPLANVLRYGEARQVPEAALATLLRHLCLEIAASLAQSCRSLDADGATAMHTRLIALDRAIPLVGDPEVAEAWPEALRRLADDAAAAAILRGFASRRLHELGIVGGEAMATALSFALSRAMPPAESGAWLEGFLGESAEILILDPELRQIIDAWLAGLAGEDFDALLPSLRRIFGAFDPTQRRRLMGELRGRGVGSDVASQAEVHIPSGREAFRHALPLLKTILGIE
jgi:hypothetical protein